MNNYCLIVFISFLLNLVSSCSVGSGCTPSEPICVCLLGCSCESCTEATDDLFSYGNSCGAQYPSKPYCASSGACVQCLDNADCGQGNTCSSDNLWYILQLRVQQ